MGKVSPNERQSRCGRQRRKSKNANNKYLKPGALAQLRNSKASASKSCMDLGKKRVGVVDSKHTVGDDAKILLNKNIDQSPKLLSPERFEFTPGNEHGGVLNQNNLQRTPKTPCAEERVFDSRLESLPIDLLVSISLLFSLTMLFVLILQIFDTVGFVALTYSFCLFVAVIVRHCFCLNVGHWNTSLLMFSWWIKIVCLFVGC